jgi:D-alanyl-lipoteichoic acid acyltransferase DltB (MBOAT superfamily)
MSVSSPDYFLFLATLFFVYWAVRRARLAAILLILAADYFFLGSNGLILLAIVPAAATCDFFLGKFIDRSQSRGIRRLLVTASILINVGLIVASKYIPFIGETTQHPNWSWVLPLSLSFYAFQAMTYTIDIYRRDARPVPSYPAYLASVSFFPTMSMGPITPVSKLAPQLLARPPLSTTDGGRALFLIGMGLVKKFLIADFLAEHLINRVFDTPTLYSGSEALVAAYSYAFQLYYDFSGYTDIALGSALLLGIALPVNFKQPYLAQNVADFWRRWHISLSNWLRDYLFFSFPGQRSKWRVYPYLVLTMAIGGFWHGPNWTFLVWGLMHGTGLAVVHAFQALRGRRKPSPRLAPRILSVLLTFHFVVFAWIFFRSPNLSGALDFLRQIASGTVSWENVTPGFLLVLAIAILAHYVPKGAYDSIAGLFSRSPAVVQAAALAGLVFAIRYIAGTGATPFIYGRF